MSLARRLWLLLLLPIAVALGVYGAVGHENTHRVLLGEASAELRNHATLVEAAVGGAVERGQLALLRQRMERVARADRILGVAAFDEGGRALLVTEHIAGSTADLADVAERARESGEDIEEEREVNGGPALIRTVTFSPSTGGATVVAVVVRDLRYLIDLANLLERGLGVTGALLLGLTALIAEIVSRVTVGRPAGAIVAGAERVAGGDLEAHVPEEGAKELAQLARAFNAMIGSLREARGQADRERLARATVERRLQHAQALVAVGQVAASIGHEIGSPLAVILGRARRAAGQADCPEQVRHELDTIALQSERISRVVARMLDLARPGRAAETGSDLGSVAGEVLEFLGPELRQRGVRARMERLAEDASTVLDADRTFQVVFNLCLNAAEAQPAGGDILVRVLSKPPGARGEGSAKVLLEVEDHGAGVPGDALGHIFEPFFTTKSDAGGTGLGLAITSSIVREAGGSIEVVSEEGKGTCFRVALPRAPDRALRSPRHTDRGAS